MSLNSDMLNQTEVSGKWTPLCSNPALPFKPTQTTDLFCFPYAGGSASVYMPWIQACHEKIRIRPVELPGRGTRLSEAVHTEFSRLLDHLEKELHPDPARSFAVFGYSMGGMVAFEWVRRLEAKTGRKPLHLFISASGGQPDNKRHRFRGSFDENALREELRRLGGAAHEVIDNQEMMKILMPYIRADFQVVDSFYRPQGVKIDTPITVYAGQDDVEISEHCYEAWLNSSRSPREIKYFPGGHFFINQHYQALLDHIGCRLFGEDA